ncbi:MAG: tetratricopeptide repeat protein [Bacteroidetes bacterium]|nr:tetratricopeptide repeat protein [Bacteroidota bacterium]
MAKLGKTLTKSSKASTEETLMLYYYKAQEYFQKNKNRVYTALTVLVVIIAVIFIYFRNQSAKNETAALELSKVKQIYAMDNFPMAVNGDSLGTFKGLQYIVDNYGSTESGETAKLMLANCYFNLRDFDKAEKYYRDFSGKGDMLKAASYAGIAAVLEAKNNFKEAANYYEKASKVNKNLYNDDEYIYYQIRCLYFANDGESVKKAAKNFKSDYPKSKYLGQIARFYQED